MGAVPVADFKGEAKGEEDVDLRVAKAGAYLVHRKVVAEQANMRLGTAVAKTRAEVRGGGRKPYQQKGTGRARVGEARNPLWRAGGTVFGPQPRSYAYSLPKKVVRGALRAALSQRFQEGAVLIVDELAAEEPKTRQAVDLLDRLDVTGKAVLVDVSPDANLSLAVRNLAGVQMTSTRQLGARDVVDAESVIMTRAAVERLEQVLGS